MSESAERSGTDHQARTSGDITFENCTESTGPGARRDCCEICTEAITPSSRTITHTANSCFNTLHRDCLSAWVESRLRNGDNATCPFCRGVIARRPRAAFPRLWIHHENGGISSPRFPNIRIIAFYSPGNLARYLLSGHLDSTGRYAWAHELAERSTPAREIIVELEDIFQPITFRGDWWMIVYGRDYFDIHAEPLWRFLHVPETDSDFVSGIMEFLRLETLNDLPPDNPDW